jgi:hypothetical protein
MEVPQLVTNKSICRDKTKLLTASPLLSITLHSLLLHVTIPFWLIF